LSQAESVKGSGALLGFGLGTGRNIGNIGNRNRSVICIRLL